MSRYPTPPESSMTDTQRSIEPGLLKQMFGYFPQLSYKDDSGNVLGPYATLYYTPELVNNWFAYGNSVLNQPHFNLREREISVLAVLSIYDTEFALYAHSEIALKCGLSKEQIQQAVNGECPDNLSESEASIYDLSLKFATIRGPLNSETFEAAAKLLGKSKVAGLVHLVTAYIQLSLLMSIADTPVPEEKEGVFRAKKGSN